jgi:hypothetical protein
MTASETAASTIPATEWPAASLLAKLRLASTITNPASAKNDAAVTRRAARSRAWRRS